MSASFLLLIMHVFHIVVGAMFEIHKSITLNHDNYNIAPSHHPLATMKFHCHSSPSKAYYYGTVNKQKLDTLHDLFFIFVVEIQEHSHLDLHATSDLEVAH